MEDSSEIDEIIADLKTVTSKIGLTLNASQEVIIDSSLHTLLDLSEREFGVLDASYVQLELILENGGAYTNSGQRDVALRVLAWAEQLKKKLQRKEKRLVSSIKLFRGSDDKTKSASYVSSERIESLRSIRNKEYDFSKLIQLCVELNYASERHSYLSVGILVRAILDHVPPIFDCTKFSEVANNYNGSRSFKESMKSLSTSLRKISDGYLHTQIRHKEELPNQIQVDFKSQLDVLLSEIIRISS